MSKVSVQMLEDTALELSVTGEKIRADGWFGNKDGLHSVAFYLSNFTGRIFLDASLETEPTSSDWFSIFLDGGNAFIEYPLDFLNPTGTQGDTKVDAVTFQGNFLWLRIRIDKTYIVPTPTTDSEKSLLGSVIKVLLNH